MGGRTDRFEPIRIIPSAEEEKNLITPAQVVSYTSIFIPRSSTGDIMAPTGDLESYRKGIERNTALKGFAVLFCCTACDEKIAFSAPDGFM